MILLPTKIKNDLRSSVQDFEYLVNIDNEIFIATRKQMLKGFASAPVLAIGGKQDERYYEDAGLTISDISERIDLKSKKPQLSSTSVTFKNFDVNRGNKNDRFSDSFSDKVGKIIKIYMKTQSAKYLADCLLLSRLKITRIKHDDKKITLTANDLNIDSLLLDIPKSEHILWKDINTFGHYSGKPVPILYGRLDAAPTQVYKENIGDGNFQIKLLPDVSYFDESEIGGVSKYHVGHVADDHYSGESHYVQKSQLVSHNTVQINIGDHLCDVTCLPYELTRGKISNPEHRPDRLIHIEPQWFEQGDHILFNVNEEYSEGHDPHIEKATLWLSINEKPISQETLGYHIRSTVTAGNSGGSKGWWVPAGGESGELDDENTMHAKDVYSNSSSGAQRVHYDIGVQRFKFKPLTGYSLNDEKDEDGDIKAFTDVHFVGNLAVLQESAGQGLQQEHAGTYIHSVYSSPVHDDNAVDEESIQPHIGFPSSVADEMNGGTADDSNFRLDLRRCTLLLDGQTNADPMPNYRTSFTQSRYAHESFNSFASRYESGFITAYPTVDATVMCLYYWPYNDYGGSVPTYADIQINIQAIWRDIELRKIWCNKDVFEKDFFVKATGKLGGVEENVKEINGCITVKYEGAEDPEFDNAMSTTDDNKDNTHNSLAFTELYKILTTPKYRTKSINGEIYDLMLATEYLDGEGDTQRSYVYDVEIEELKFFDDDNIATLPRLLYGTSGSSFARIPPDDEDFSTVYHEVGWVMKFKGKLFGEAAFTSGQSLRSAFVGVKLVYGKKQYSNQNLIDVLVIADANATELQLFNFHNTYELGDEAFIASWQLGYTNLTWDEENESKLLLERPHEIMQDLISGQDIDVLLDQSKIDEIFNTFPNYRLAFSITERTNTQDIIEELCRQSNFYYRYRARDQKIVINIFKAQYDDSDVNGIIDINKMLRFDFSKTKIEDSSMGGVIVRYGYNYATKKFDKRTPKRDTGTYRDEYKEYYGIDDLNSYSVELDAPYIQDEATANVLRDYQYELNKHPRLVCKFTLPTSEGIQYEVGDVVRFSDNPNNTRPYGRSLLTSYTLIEQEVTPYFFITKVSRSLFKIKIECVQLHTLSFELPPVSLLGDINLDGQVTWEEEGSDLELLIDMVANGTTPYNEQQIANADINGDTNVDNFDLVVFYEMFIE